MPHPDRILLLGEDCKTYGEVAYRTTPHRIACALTVGADRTSPSKQFKKYPEEFPNEDGLLVISDGVRSLLAVADAHFGHESSHAILRGLHDRCTALPDTPEAVRQTIADCVLADAAGDYDSETTLLVAHYDHAAGRGFGISFGDSTLAIVDAHGVEVVTGKNHDFVTPRNPSGFAPEREQGFAFRTGPGQLLCAFTDGIDECHYRSPETSVRPEHMIDLFGAVGADPGSFAERLVALALAGVGGNPGGQDNIALVVVAT